MSTIGAARARLPADPKKGTPPKEKIPPVLVVSQ
jgi:hypothetical protein